MIVKRKCRGCFGKGEGFSVAKGVWEICKKCKGTGQEEVEMSDWKPNDNDE